MSADPLVAIADVAEVVSGYAFPRHLQGDLSGDVPFLKVSDMNLAGNEVEIRSWNNAITRTTLADLGARSLPRGTVIFPKVGAAIATEKKRLLSTESTIDNNVMGIVPNDSVDPRYLYYWMCSIELGRLANQGPVPSIRKSDIERLLIPLAARDRQTMIVRTLDRISAIRQKRRVQVEYVARVEERILDATLNPSFDHGSARIVPLSELLVDLRYGTSAKCFPHRDGIPVLRIPNVVGGELDLTDLKYANLPDIDRRRLTLEDGDLLFVRTNGNPTYVGRCAVFDRNETFAFASYLIRARLRMNEVDPRYLVSFLNSTTGRRAMAPWIRTTAGQSNLGLDGINRIPVVLPTLDRQMELGERREKLRKLKGSISRSVALLNLLLSRAIRSVFDDEGV